MKKENLEIRKLFITLKELLHLTYNEDGKYIVSWKRPDFQVESEYESSEISKEDFELLGKLLNNPLIEESAS